MSEKCHKSVSLILPVYNEKALLLTAVDRCVKALEAEFSDFEIIIVDDGSRDGISDILSELKQMGPHIQILQNNVNLNVGIAVQRGLATARCEYVVHNAVDLPLAPEGLRKLVEFMDGSDLLVIQRNSYAGYQQWRIVTSAVNRALLNLLFPHAVKGLFDLNYTQLYRKAIIPKILPLAKSPAFTTPEMILRARLMKLGVKQIVSDYEPRLSGKGAFGKPHDILWSMYDMFRFRIKLWTNRSQTLNR